MEKTQFKNYMAATYQIRVQGYLDASWSPRLGGLSITSGTDESGDRPVTVLAGRLRDQAALLGILNTLYDMQFPRCWSNAWWSITH